MCTACAVTCDGLCQATNAKAPIKGLIDVSVIAPGTVVFRKSAVDVVVRCTVEGVNIRADKDEEIGYTIRYSVTGYSYYLLGENLLPSSEEAFKY